MKLNVFDYINQAADKLESERQNLIKSAQKLTAYMEKSFENEERVVGVGFRVKTSDSLKEKIVRNNLYKEFDADELIFKMSDVIGVRIECRFLADEEDIFERIKELFCNTDDGVYFYPDGKKHLKLDLSSQQPQRQKNGLGIYRIDGNITVGASSCNFELQIKSLVNSFWSEIEHKIIYKNKRFMMIDKFVNELMESINQNLINIDSQLNMLYNRCLDNSTVEKGQQIENLLVVFINDIYASLVEQRCGFNVNIKPYSDSMVQYILKYSSFVDGVDIENDNKYGDVIVRIMRWMHGIDFDEVNIGEEIELKEVIFESDLERAISDRLLKFINTDFYVNTFFHILFSLEVGDDVQDFVAYVKYYAFRVGQNKTDEQTEKLKYLIAVCDPAKMLQEKEINRLSRLEE